MLSSETDRPQPNESAFAFRKPLEHDQHAVTSRSSSQNNDTRSDVEAQIKTYRAGCSHMDHLKDTKVAKPKP
ncbi:hypothetical protein RJ641_018167 [Dillenia turbinata]|uniref:Uncharacterized protein n=1 Tax=Dillenia turbinata TaxID=194707 RepID=A0AAN8YY51_9MAGN